MLEWMDEALCLGMHQDIWFPPVFSEERTAPEKDYYDVAKMVCEHCPVSRQCGLLGADQEAGVWGGTDPKERSNGLTPKPSEYVLIPRYLDKLPKHDPKVQVDIPALRTLLKRYADKR